MPPTQPLIQVLSHLATERSGRPPACPLIIMARKQIPGDFHRNGAEVARLVEVLTRVGGSGVAVRWVGNPEVVGVGGIAVDAVEVDFGD